MTGFSRIASRGSSSLFYSSGSNSSGAMLVMRSVVSSTPTMCRNGRPITISHRQLQQVRSFFRSSRQGSSSSESGGSRKFHFEREDPGLRWTAVLSNPASVDGPKGIPSRAEQLQKLQNQEEEDENNEGYDVLVIGGGATGAGVALDAASRGLKTACLERGDFASETSSRSTKLIWAGLKYMGTAMSALMSPQKVWEKGVGASFSDFWKEMMMVYHCHVERRYMTTQNRHLCHWIPICVPFASWYLDPPPMNYPLFAIFPMVAPVVFKLYDSLSGFSCPSSYVLFNSTAAKVFPQLDTTNLKYSAVFYEAQHNDSRTNVAIALTAAEKGAHICNYVAVIQLIKDSTGKVTGVVALDRMTGKHFSIRAKKVVFAGGPFTDSLRQLEIVNNPNDGEAEKLKPAVRGAHGSHLVLPGRLMPQGPKYGDQNDLMGLLDCNTADGRFLFVLPWLNHTLIGTTDVKGPAQTLPSATEEDVDFILNEASKYFHDKDTFTTQQVTSSWRGWRPLAVDPHAAPDAPVSRDHVISEHPETGCMFIAGGKWTTWREMAQDTVDKLTDKPCQTLDIALLGAEGYSDELVDQVHSKFSAMLDRSVCQHLVDTYGGRVWDVCGLISPSNNLSNLLVEGFPYIQAEVIYACREYACSVEDILSRRTRLAYLDHRAALKAMATVAKLMQKELGWSKSVTEQQIEAAKVYMDCYASPIEWKETEKP